MKTINTYKSKYYDMQEAPNPCQQRTDLDLGLNYRRLDRTL
jgi:hypothetical protein